MEFNINIHRLEYLVRLLKKHGYSVLRNNKNKSYSKEFKVVAINRVLFVKESKTSVAIDIGLSSDEFYIIGLKNTKKTVIMS